MADATTPTDDFSDAEFLAAFDALNSPAPANAGADTEDGLPDTLDIDFDDETAPEGDEADGEQPETEQDDEDSEKSSETYTVKVDGEEVEVNLDEALKGYMRRADYQRKTQEVAKGREELEAAQADFNEHIGKFEDQLGRLQALDTAWDKNPSEVLSAFVLSTENPSQAIVEQVKAAAVAGRLNSQLSKLFGVTDEVIAQLRNEQETQVQSRATQAQVAEGESAKAELERLREQAKVQEAISAYEAQITEIAEADKLDLSTQQARAEFRSELTRFALDNDIRDLKTAYKLLKVEKAEAAAAARTAEKSKARVTNVAGRSNTGSGARPVKPKANSYDDAFNDTWAELGLPD